jgi:branched-chain amino acid transport system ATP-binding protein
LLTVRSLSAGYGAATVVRDAALEVGDGELVAVLGANGAGKTTLLRALSGLIRPMAGEVRVLGWRIDQLAGDRIARAGLILVPEGRQVFPTSASSTIFASAPMRADQPARRAGSKRCSSALLRSRRAATSAPASFQAVSSRCSRSPAA